MSDLPAQELDSQLVIDALTTVMEALHEANTPRDAAFGGCAMASFILYRDGRNVDENMDLLEEYSLWLHAQMADNDGS